MWWWCWWLWCGVVVGGVSGLGPQDSITVSGNGYRGVVVGLRADLNEAFCDPWVQYLQAVLTSASAVLYQASNRKLYFDAVTIVIPKHWDCFEEDVSQANTTELVWEDSHIRLIPRDPVFGDNPWTQQPRGCGQPGDFIALSNKFIVPDDSAAKLDPSSVPELAGQLVVHEWAKLRWGVFEEYGHPGDHVFPSTYRSSLAPPLQPNYCTDAKMIGNFSKNCGEEDPEEGCYFIPDAELSKEVNSSLLAVPSLPTVTKFCDEETHDPFLPTKHNLLCGRRSVWEVIERHQDFQRPSGADDQDTTPNITVVSAADTTTTSNTNSEEYSESAEANPREPGFEVSLWASEDLTNLHFTASSVPTLFAKVTQGWRHVVYADSVTVVVTAESGLNATLALHDDGVAGDVTGNDGVYSALMTSVEPPSIVTLIATARGTPGTTMFVGPSSSSEVQVARRCCGSVIDLSGVHLEQTGEFTVQETFHGNLTGEVPINLPPVQVTDLRSSREGHDVTLTFTAPGKDLDQGKASTYLLKREDVASGNTSFLAWKGEGAEAGTTVTLSTRLPYCGAVFAFTVTAVDDFGASGRYSNEVREVVKCVPEQKNKLGPGQIAGIVVGGVLALVLICASVYLFVRWDERSDLWLWKGLICVCCRRKKEDPRSRPLPAKPGDVQTVF